MKPDLVGKNFGRLLVVSRYTQRMSPDRWNCVCECGNITITRGSHMKSGASKSCGCLSREMAIKRARKHGMTGTPEHKTWVNIRARCYDKSHVSYKHYGALGLTVCKRWEKFSNFLKDMGRRPSKDHSIDRKKNSKGYSPSNCSWATEREQQNNRRNNRWITVNGKTLTMAQWEREMGLPKGLITMRIRMGWTEQKAVITPKRS